MEVQSTNVYVINREASATEYLHTFASDHSSITTSNSVSHMEDRGLTCGADSYKKEGV